MGAADLWILSRVQAALLGLHGQQPCERIGDGISVRLRVAQGRIHVAQVTQTLARR